MFDYIIYVGIIVLTLHIYMYNNIIIMLIEDYCMYERVSL